MTNWNAYSPYSDENKNKYFWFDFLWEPEIDNARAASLLSLSTTTENEASVSKYYNYVTAVAVFSTT